jgi:hypothetical protein
MCRQVLFATAARHSARLRQKGLLDPFDADDANVTGAELHAMGVTEADLTTELISHARWRARTLSEIGDFAAARGVWRQAAEIAREILPQSPVRKELRRAEAKLLRKQGHVTRSRVVARLGNVPW